MARIDEVVIVPYPDGPVLVRGPFVMRDHEGVEIEVDRRTVALCRCGRSRTRPFCDGTHQLARFRAGSAPERAGSAPERAASAPERAASAPERAASAPEDRRAEP